MGKPAPAGTTKKLTDKQKLFVREYLVDLNGTQAALRAGYSKGNEKAAGVEAVRLLADPRIQAAMAEGQAAIAERTEVTVDRIVQEYAAIAFSRVDELMELGSSGVRLKPFKKLSKKALAAILEVREHTLRDGTKSISFKLHSKGDALEALGRHLGMFGDSLKVQKAIEEMLENVRTRMPEEAYGHFVTAIGAAMGLAPVASGPAATAEAGAEPAAGATRH